MSGIERMAMLTARGASLQGGRGGADRLTAQDVAAATSMARLSRLSGALAWAVGTGDLMATAELRKVWAADVLDHGRANGWDDGTPMSTPRMLWLAALTLDEVLRVPLCPQCNGCGKHHNQRECAACDGAGRVPRLTTADYAEVLAVSVGEWRGTWQARHRERLGVLDVAMSEADRIDRKLWR